MKGMVPKERITVSHGRTAGRSRWPGVRGFPSLLVLASVLFASASARAQPLATSIELRAPRVLAGPAGFDITLDPPPESPAGLLVGTEPP